MDHCTLRLRPVFKRVYHMIKIEPHHPQSPASTSGDIRDQSTTSANIGNIHSISSEQLLGLRGELKILHNGGLYSLRRTRQGKLILTK